MSYPKGLKFSTFFLLSFEHFVDNQGSLLFSFWLDNRMYTALVFNANRRFQLMYLY